VARIRVSTVIDAPPDVVWADVRRIGSHVEWMEDAAEIRFTADRREGVGTAFECDTRVGPFRLTDRLVVTEWVDGRRLGIRHEGVVTGTGRFSLDPMRRQRTRFTWRERVMFPWWLGGPVGAQVAAPVLRAVWRRNLRNLRRRFS
jgi:hypothetical protein